MVFPIDLRDILVELYINGWVDVTDDCRYADGVTVSRGQSPNSTAATPFSFGFTLNNRDGRYSKRNPMGPYYGLFRQNTPCRMAVRKVRDLFARTVASGFGSAPVESSSTTPWTTGGSAGTASVTPGTGTQTVATAGQYTHSYLAGVSYGDVDVAVKWSYATGNVTGASVEPGNVMARVASSTSYYMARVSITTAEAITVSIHSFADGQLVAPVTVSFAHVAGQEVWTRLQCEGQTLRAKIWLASGLEPYDWTVETHHSGIAAGGVGVRTGVVVGNTNTPVSVSYKDFQVIRMRSAGELSELPVEWDTSGNDVYTTVSGGGLLRRLGQGDSPLRSALRRTLPSVSSLRAYWPAEEGSDATGIASALSDGQPMGLNGRPSFGSYSDIKASAPLPTTNSARWTGNITPYSATSGMIQYRFLMHVPSGGDTDAAVVASIYNTGSAFLWEIIYNTASSGSLKIRVWDSPFTLVLDTGTLATSVNGHNFQVSLELQNSGANTGWVLGFLEVGATSGFFFSGTLVGYQVSQAIQASINPTADIGLGLTGTAIGHITVQSTITSFFDRFLQLNAYVGETAGTRAARLSSEEGIPFAYIGSLTTTAAMGPQTTQSVLDLIMECVAADQATLYEARSHMCLVFRARSEDYNQAAALTQDYALGQVADPFKPTPDDQAIRNDVTAKRVDGSSYRVQQTTGPFKVSEPKDGGVGRYDTAPSFRVQSDLQLSDLAGWLLHLGTVDEDRYPGITINLANPNVVAAGLDDAAMDVDVQRRVAVINPKAGAGSPDPVSQLVRGYRERFTQREHKITFACVPASPYEVIQLEVGDLGRLDADTAVTGSSMTSSGATIELAGEVWSTDVPYDLGVTGERMTLTAVTDIVPAWVSAGTATHGDNASCVPGLPAGAAAGDVLVIVAGIRNFAATVNTPAGYSSIAGLGNLNIMTKVHSGSEAAPTVTFSGGAAGDSTTAVMFALRNCPATFFGQSNSASVPAVQDIVLPAIGGTIADGIAIAIGHKFDDWTGSAPPSGFTEGVDVSTTLGNDQGLTVAYKTFVGTLVQGADQFTITGGGTGSNRSIIMLFGNWQRGTVTRSVNGVVKSHAAGEDIRLWRPSYLAY